MGQYIREAEVYESYNFVLYIVLKLSFNKVCIEHSICMHRLYMLNLLQTYIVQFNIKTFSESKAQKAPISTCRWTLKLICLIFYAHCIAVIASIRYGFLADSFSRRHVPGKIYGFIEGSMFIGFAGCFITRAAEGLMKRVNSKYLMMGYQAAFTATSIATIQDYSTR